MTYESQQRIVIPRTCPNCGDKLTAIRYQAVFNILKPRSWIVCEGCNFEQTSDEYKKGLLTV